MPYARASTAFAGAMRRVDSISMDASPWASRPLLALILALTLLLALLTAGNIVQWRRGVQLQERVRALQDQLAAYAHLADRLSDWDAEWAIEKRALIEAERAAEVEAAGAADR